MLFKKVEYMKIYKHSYYNNCIIFKLLKIKGYDGPFSYFENMFKNHFENMLKNVSNYFL